MENSQVENDIHEYLHSESVNKEDLCDFVEYLLSYKVKLHNQNLIESFCKFLFDKLKGNKLPNAFKTAYNVSFNRKRAVSFNESTEVFADRLKMYSNEGREQFLREKRIQRMYTNDPKKKFFPRKTLSQLNENQTMRINLNQAGLLNLKEHIEPKYFNFCTLSLEEIIDDPLLLNKYASS